MIKREAERSAREADYPWPRIVLTVIGMVGAIVLITSAAVVALDWLDGRQIPAALAAFFSTFTGAKQ